MSKIYNIPTFFKMNIPSLDDLFPKPVYDIYTDGSANLNISAGYGIVILHNNKIIYELSGTVTHHFTAPHAELTAIIEALKFMAQFTQATPIINVYSDSTFCTKTINEWGPNRKNWSTAAHADKFIPLLAYINNYRKVSQITFTHVKGHSGNPYNERADKLAKKGNFLLTQ